MLSFAVTFRKHSQAIGNVGKVVVVVNHCFTLLFGTKGLLSDIIIQ